MLPSPMPVEQGGKTAEPFCPIVNLWDRRGR